MSTYKVRIEATIYKTIEVDVDDDDGENEAKEYAEEVFSEWLHVEEINGNGAIKSIEFGRHDATDAWKTEVK